MVPPYISSLFINSPDYWKTRIVGDLIRWKDSSPTAPRDPGQATGHGESDGHAPQRAPASAWERISQWMSYHFMAARNQLAIMRLHIMKSPWQRITVPQSGAACLAVESAQCNIRFTSSMFQLQVINDSHGFRQDTTKTGVRVSRY